MTPIERQHAIDEGRPIDRQQIALLHPDYAAKILGYRIEESNFQADKLAEREINMYRRYGVDKIMVTYTKMKLYSNMMVRDLKDVDILDLSAYTFDKEKRQQVNYEAIERIHNEIGDEIRVTYGVSAPLTMAGGLVPHTTILRGMRKNPEAVHKLLRFATDFIKQMADKFSALGKLDYILFDPVASGSLISPKQYREFALPYTKEIIAYLRKYADHITLHVCGNTTKVLKDIAATDADAFSLDQEVDLNVAKETVGHDIKLVGNVDPTQVLMQGTPDDVRQAVKENFQKAYDSPNGYMILSGCGTPYATPEENIEAYMETSRYYANCEHQAARLK